MKTYRPLGVRLLLWAALGFLATTVKSTTASSSVADASGVVDSFSLAFTQPPATLYTDSMITSVSATTPAASASDGANSQQTTGQSAPLVSSTTQPSTAPASSTTLSSTGTTDSYVASTSSDLASVPGVSGGITASAPQQTSSSERLAVDSMSPISSVITPSTVPSTSVDMTSTTNAPLSSDYDGSTTATASVMPSSDIDMTLGQSTTVDGGTVTLATSVSDITIVQTAPVDNTMSPTVTLTSIGDTPFASSKIDSSIVSSSSDNSPVISPTLVNSPMVSSSSDSPIISSTFVDSPIVSATVVDSHIFPSSSDVTSSSSFVSSLYDSMVSSSSFTDSSMMSSFIAGGVMSSSTSTDSSMMSSLPADSSVVYSSLVDSSVLSSAPDYSSMVSSAPIDSSVISSAPFDSTMISSATIDSTMISSAPIDSTMISSAPIDSTMISSAPIDSTMISSAPIGSTMISSAPIDSAVMSSAPIDSTVISSAPIDSTMISSAPIDSTMILSAPVFSTMISSAPIDSTVISPAPIDSTISSAPIDSTMISSAPIDSTMISSAPIDSTVISSAPIFSTMITSAPIDSTMISSAPIDSTMISSAPIFSTMISPAPIDSTLISSAPIDSTMISSAPIDSTVISSVPIFSTMISSAPIDSTVISSVPIDSTVTSSAPIDSTMVSSAPIDSTVISSAPINSTVISSAPIDSTVVSSAPIDSTVISSAPIDSTMVSSATVSSSLYPMDSTVISSSMDSTLISSSMDSTVIPSPMDSTVIMPSSVIETQPMSSFPTTAFSLDSSFQQFPSSDFIVSTVAMETPSLHSSSAFSTSNQIVSASPAFTSSSPTSVVMDSSSEQLFSTVVVMDTTTEIPDTTVFFFDTTTDVPVTTMVVMETTTEQPDTTMVVMNTTSWLPDVTASVAMTTSAGVGLTTDVSWNMTDTTTPIPLTTTERMLNTSQVFSQYWMKTEILVPVTENVSDSSFSSKMEARLASLYNQAIQMDYDIMRGRYDPGGSGRNRRAIADGNATIQMTGISRHSEVDFNTDLLYYLVENGSMTDVSRTEYLINMFTPQEVAIALGYVVENQGERYIPLPVHDRKLWIIGAVVGALVAVIVIIWLVLFIYIKCTRPSSLSPRSPRQKQAEAGLGSYPRDVKGFDFVRTEVGLRSDRQQQQQSSENEYHRRYQHPSSGELDTPPPTYPGVSRQSSASEGHKSRWLTDSPGSSRKTNGQAHCASPRIDSFEEGSDYTEAAPLKLSTLKGQRSRSPKKPRIKKKEAGDEYSTGLVRPTKLPPLNLETRQNGDVAPSRNKQGPGPKKPIRTPSHKGSQDSNGVITGSHEDTRQVGQKKKKTKRNAPVPPEKSDLIEMNTLTGSHSTALLGPQARLRQDTAMDIDDQLESDDSQPEPTGDPRLRMHELLDEAFSLVTPFQDSDDKSKEALSQETKDRGQKHEPLQVGQYKRQPHDYAHSLWQPHDVSDEAAKILTDSLPPGSIATPTPAMKQPRSHNRSGRNQPRVHHPDEIANPAYMTDDLHNPAQSLMQSVKTPQDIRKSLVPDNYTSIAMDTRTFNGDALPTSQVKWNSKVEKPYQPNKTPSKPTPDLTNNVSHLHNGLKASKPSSSVIGQRGTKIPATNGKIYGHIENSDDDDEVDVVSRVMKPGNKSEPLVASIREELERLAHRPNEAAPGLSYSVRT